VAAGSVLARKRSNVRGAKGPCHLRCLRRKEGKDEMTKASIDLQDMRRRLYGKAKAEPSWRFWVRRHLAQARKREGFKWERWSRPWRYDTLRLVNSHCVRRDDSKVVPV
jgi:hypothetical protein